MRSMNRSSLLLPLELDLDQVSVLYNLRFTVLLF